jgi:hypothetical protein
MSIDKSLYQAPMGLDSLLGAMSDEPPDIEIEIDDPDALHIAMGGLEIDFDSKAPDEDFDENLAELLDDGELSSIASELLSDFDDDVSARRDWITTYTDGLELLGMKIEERTEPWDGACGVHHPLLSEALVKFQAETMMATFPSAGPVKTTIIGKETQSKKDSAARVQDDMNYQLLDRMTEYRPEHERMLWGLGLSGNAFKKVYFDPRLNRQVSVFVPAEDMVVPYGASNLETAERVTHVMRKTENEMRRLQVAGFYRDIDLGEPDGQLDDVEKKIAEKMGFRATSDDRYKILEMHVDLDLPGFEDTDEDGEETGIALPYVVTIEKGTQEILSIRRNWEPDDETYTKRQHFVHYGYVPGFGFYCFGLIHLIGAFAKSGTSLIRQLVDAGTLSNLPGGFKSRGMRIKGDDTPISPGEWRDVDVPSGTIRDNLIPLPYKEPSQTLMALLNQIVEEGRRFANAADLQVSDMSGQAPVGTTLAILERTLKVITAVQARVHYSMKQELGLLKKIIAAYAPEDYEYEPEEGSRKAKKSDYETTEVIPVSDPNASTMAQKIVQYQAVLQLAQGAPQLYNLPVLHRQMLDALGIKDAQKLVPLEEDKFPVDPVSENQNILRLKPVKAFLNQDHNAHIAVHMAMMQDPKIMGTLQGNPLLPQIQATVMAHVAEHLGFQYRKDVEVQLGMQMPPQEDDDGEDMKQDPEVEAALAPLLAQAATQLLQQNQAGAAQQRAQQQAQDPLIQMQMQELQLKAQEQQRKAQKDQTDAQLKMQQLQVERERIASQAAMADKSAQIDVLKNAAQLGVKQSLDKGKQTHDEKKLQVEALKNAADMTMKKEDQQRKTQVQALKDAAQITAKKTETEMSLAHQAYQGMLERERAQTEKAEDMAHQAYQNSLEREHKQHHKILDVAHQGHQAEINRIHQKEQVEKQPKEPAKKPKKGEE